MMELTFLSIDVCSHFNFSLKCTHFVIVPFLVMVQVSPPETLSDCQEVSQEGVCRRHAAEVDDILVFCLVWMARAPFFSVFPYFSFCVSIYCLLEWNGATQSTQDRR